jgi:hypothetical protein
MAEEIKSRCGCANCRVRSLMGPILLITIGVIFLVGQYTRFSFMDLWPIILIVIGVVLIGQTLVSRAGHTGS